MNVYYHFLIIQAREVLLYINSTFKYTTILLQIQGKKLKTG